MARSFPPLLARPRRRSARPSLVQHSSAPARAHARSEAIASAAPLACGPVVAVVAPVWTCAPTAVVHSAMVMAAELSVLAGLPSGPPNRCLRCDPGRHNENTGVWLTHGLADCGFETPTAIGLPGLGLAAFPPRAPVALPCRCPVRCSHALEVETLSSLRGSRGHGGWARERPGTAVPTYWPPPPSWEVPRTIA